MGKKIADEKIIVAEAQKKFGHLSDDIKNATSLRELTPALRALAFDTASSDPAVCEEALSFSKKYELKGI